MLLVEILRDGNVALIPRLPYPLFIAPEQQNGVAARIEDKEDTQSLELISELHIPHPYNIELISSICKPLGRVALTLQLGHGQSVDLAWFRQEPVDPCLLAEQRIPLGALSAREYVAAEPVLGAALAVLMRARPEERVDLKLGTLARVQTSGLDAARQFLLVNLIETYFTLDGAEQAAYERRVGRGGNMAIKDLEMTWADRMRAEGRTAGREEGRTVGREEGRTVGREEGALMAKRAVLLDQVRIRFGEVPTHGPLATQTAQADDTWLTTMPRRAVTSASMEELIG